MATVGARAARVPAAVISGFLGSGKTTLVCHLLADAQRRGLRLAVISNEFGALGIDRALFGGEESYVELAGGCVCCQLSNDLLDTLQRLREEVDPERIVIETSGVALPSETQLNFYREPVRSWIGDDLGLVVVNAEQVAAGRDLEGTFEDQLTSADVIVLNKLDLVSARDLASIEARLRAIEPEAPIVHARHGDIDPDLVFLSGTRGGTPPRDVHRDHTHEAFVTDELHFPAGIAAAEVEAAIRTRTPLRAKGFVVTADGVCLVQGVGPRIQIEPAATAPEPALLGRVVVIHRAA